MRGLKRYQHLHAMRLSELLSLDRISTTLTVPSKDAALDAVATLLAHGDGGLDPSVVRAVLHARERQQSTGVGDEVAIPHGRIAGLPRLTAALMVLPEGVDFDSIDQRPVRILVAILAPEQSAGDHLRALARVAKLLRDPSIRNRLLDAHSAEEALQVVVGEEASLPP
jgi:PTS system nitrogen regulatory IIA component